ncbi:uncharacterized protein N7498_004198 [Penicillium cinerascens]|uniref:Uncharacterized protein n=1 Tax=Penicillium cinerascens TaxID=70096 RepID=A0A9W9T7M7_9EURO|nr:uncharacterized protein N7498_004198 [Penicillium cinerascens]KAJ5212552.1 hypothetical protein N7498_004198 [Penicillium cinerascens]
MITTELHARRQRIMDSVLSQPPQSNIELHHPPPSDIQPHDAGHLATLRMLVVNGPRAETVPDRNPETRDAAISIKPQNETNEVEHRFWNETTSEYADSPALLANTGNLAKPSNTSLNSGHPSIAAATIIGVIIFGAICFLLFWYIRRERRRRHLRQIQSPSQDLFNPSSLSLGPETSKTLDDFLMRDVPPERASLMFSRTRSPSVTYVVDEANPRSNRNSYDESSSLTKLDTLDTLTRLSVDGTRLSFMLSELPFSLQGPSPQYPATQHTSITSKRASLASTVPPSPRSSQLWTTTTAATTASGTTEKSSLLAQETASSRTSQSIHTSNGLPSPASASMQPHSSNGSRGSSQYSGGSVVRSSPREIIDPRGPQHVISRSSQSVSPIAESTISGNLPSGPATPSPLFRFSEA